MLPIQMTIPRFSFVVPSTGKKVSMRPFLVGEQKSMILSLGTEDIDTAVNAIKTMLHACSDGTLDPDTLSAFDTEYLFLKLRSKSIGESVSLKTECRKCSKEVKFSVDLENIDPPVSNSKDLKIMLTDSIGVMMRYPSIEQVLKMRDQDYADSVVYDVVVDCIASVFNATEFVDSKDHPRESIVHFVDSLTAGQYNKINTFVISTPTVVLYHTTTCECGNPIKVKIEGIENFFD